jgi:tRNA/tmRNA/rRNA uracil-C5-methylase (TrmA/RlmC/RlmD family)
MLNWSPFLTLSPASAPYDFLQADVLYKLIEDSTGLKGDGSEIVLDLFCGTGTIGLTLARR